MAQSSTPSAAQRFQRELLMVLKRCVKLSRRREIHVRCGAERLTVRPTTSASVVESFARSVRSIHVHVSNLGRRSDPHRIRWHRLRFPLPRRLLHSFVGLLCSFLPASEIKNRLYRAIGMSVGRNVEISVGAFIDPFSPRLITIGDGTVIGAFAMLFTHGYRGQGRVFFGSISIGDDCMISALSTIGPCMIGDRVTILPGVVTIPFYQRIESGAVITPRSHSQGLDPTILKEFED